MDELAKEESAKECGLSFIVCRLKSNEELNMLLAIKTACVHWRTTDLLCVLYNIVYVSANIFQLRVKLSSLLFMMDVPRCWNPGSALTVDCQEILRLGAAWTGAIMFAYFLDCNWCVLYKHFNRNLIVRRGGRAGPRC